MKKKYNPQKIENLQYNSWEKNNCFTFNNKKGEKNFCIVIPPPNVTGSLHMGHAFQQTIMDIMIRYNRMKGKNTLWQVGTDHAGIAMQNVVERYLFLQEKKTKKDFSRKEFVKKIWKWKKINGNKIYNQMKRLGNSVNWKRRKFTLDKHMSQAVQKAFFLLYKKQLIYKKKSLTNWDPKLNTVVSDLEVKKKYVDGKIWYIKYYFLSLRKSKKKYLTIATTRPETLLGDTAIAVNPKDKRYLRYIGKYVVVPIINRIIPVISDSLVKIKKGTGCVKVTPGHDFIDYNIGEKHNLPIISFLEFNNEIKKKLKIYNFNGSICYDYSNKIPKRLQKQNYLYARKKIIKEIVKKKFLEKVKNYKTMVLYGERSEEKIEPMLTDQWYLKTKSLAKKAVKAVKNKEIEFVPKKYKNMFFSWMKNIKDWCISRQLWWGHRIPIFYDKKKNIFLGKSKKDVRKKYFLKKKEFLKQEESVLDTWFSSSLWSFASLDWPKKKNLLKLFHPTNVLVTGFDIIFFWVARMIMITICLIKNKYGKYAVPFKKVYITGLIRDEFGRKMSKSYGNVIDPVNVIDGISLEKLIQKRTKNFFSEDVKVKIIKETKKNYPNGLLPFGADALRFTFASVASGSRTINWDIKRLQGYKNFCNKIWNASYFVLENVKDVTSSSVLYEKKMDFLDIWIVSVFQKTLKKYTKAIKQYRFDIAAHILYNFVWNTVCDWYLEFLKVIFKKNTISSSILYSKIICLKILKNILLMAHPIIPFITDFIWKKIQKLKKKKKIKSIMLQRFPQFSNTLIDKESILLMNLIKKIITKIRNFRLKFCISQKKKISLFFIKNNSFLKKNINLIKDIINSKKIRFVKKKHIPVLSILIKVENVFFAICIKGVIKKEVELKRIKNEIYQLSKKVKIIQKELLNKKFMNFAPMEVINKKKKLLLSYQLLKEDLLKQKKAILYL